MNAIFQKGLGSYRTTHCSSLQENGHETKMRRLTSPDSLTKEEPVLCFLVALKRIEFLFSITKQRDRNDYKDGYLGWDTR